MPEKSLLLYGIGWLLSCGAKRQGTEFPQFRLIRASTIRTAGKRAFIGRGMAAYLQSSEAHHGNTCNTIET